MHMNQIFYALFAETEHLFFFVCSGKREFIEEYASLLVHLYQLSEDAFEQECFYTAFAGNREEIIETFNKSNGIKENRLERVSSILHELDKIFTGQTDIPFIYVDGKPEHLQEHFELVDNLLPNHRNNITDI
jgi:hypothetical protein